MTSPVIVPRELLEDLRDLAFDSVERHRAAMGAYRKSRQALMDSVLASVDALLAAHQHEQEKGDE